MRFIDYDEENGKYFRFEKDQTSNDIISEDDDEIKSKDNILDLEQIFAETKQEDPNRIVEGKDQRDKVNRKRKTLKEMRLFNALKEELEKRRRSQLQKLQQLQQQIDDEKEEKK